MPAPKDVSTDPMLLGSLVVRNHRCGGRKFMILIQCLLGLACVMLLSQAAGRLNGDHQKATFLLTPVGGRSAPRSAASARVQHFLQPLKFAWVAPAASRDSVQMARKAPERYDPYPNKAGSQVIGRRAALASGLLVGATLPQGHAFAGGIADLFNPNTGATKKKKTDDVQQAEEGGIDGGTAVLGVLGGGVLLSLPLYFDNLRRLAIKVVSGGKDDGYDSIPPSESDLKKDTGGKDDS